MKHTKWMVIMLVLALTLTMVSGCSAEQADEAGAVEASGMDVAVDEALPEGGTQDDDRDASGNSGVQIPFALKLDTTTVSLDYSQSATLTASASIGADSIQWACSDEGVASISRTTGESVTLTAINEGTATVTCSLGGTSQICEVTVKPAQTLQITGVDYPATLAIGKSWKLRNGTVASTDNLTSLTSVIKDANGAELAPSHTETFSGDVKRFDIGGIDTYVPFSRITTEGTYTWALSATDASGRSVSLDLPINAVSEGDTAVATEAGAYASATHENDASEEGEPQANAPDSDHAQADAEPMGGSGVNLILNSDFARGTEHWVNWNGKPEVLEIIDDNGKNWVHLITDPTQLGQGYVQSGIPVEPNTSYTLSARVKGAKADQRFYLGVSWRDKNDKQISTQPLMFNIGPEEQIITATFTSEEEAKAVKVLAGNRDEANSVSESYELWFTDLKLEKGESSTTWSPAPEDAYADLVGRTVNISVPIDGWSADAENQNLFHIDIPSAGISCLNRTVCIAFLVQTGTEADDAPARESFAQLTRGVIGDGKITLYALRPPMTSFTLRLVTIATAAPVTEIIGLS